MPSWTANYALSLEIAQDAINRVLERILQAMQAQLSFSARLGRIGSINLTLNDLSVVDMEDPQPLGGVVTDVKAEGHFIFRLFGLRLANTSLVVTIEDVEIDFATTSAGLPRSIILRVTPSMKISIRFPQSRFIMGWLLNRVIAPLISLGVWLAFRILRKVEVPVWEIVDIFATLGLRFAPNSPLLTAQDQVIPQSLLIASSFNLTGNQSGNPNQLVHFIPPQTNIGAAVNERVITSAVQTAFSKGWAPTRFKVGKWKIYINSIGVAFEKDKIIAQGQLKAKRGKCWCRVKARITFKVEIKPEVKNAQTSQPELSFQYQADIRAHISTSGMLVVLGVIMFAPIFMTLTVALSHLINIQLQKFPPFRTTWSQQGLTLTVQANAINFQGFVPLSMHFPLQLSGQGSYDLSRFQQFQLPGGTPLDVDFTDESVAVQQDEFRMAVKVS